MGATKQQEGGTVVGSLRTLDQLPVGQKASIARLDAAGDFRARLLSLGFVPGGSVCAILESPWGDPVAYEICGAVIALRRADARQVMVISEE